MLAIITLLSLSTHSLISDTERREMMESLLNISSSSSLTITNINNKHNSCCFLIRRRDILLPIATTAGHRINYATTTNNNNINTLLLISSSSSRRIASLLPISASRLSYHAQIHDLQQDDDDDDQIDQDLGSSRKVNVRFQLQRECSYGEQFYIVGDDPMFGSWNPDNAVPLQWSEGHIWTANLDIAIGKTIQFKFLLKSGGGGIEDHLTWQPGSDRVLTTWETSKRIVVCEDWDDELVQKIMEEEEEEDDDDEMMLQEEEEISPEKEKEEVLIKETTAAAMENVISRMVEEEPEVTAA